MSVQFVLWFQRKHMWLWRWVFHPRTVKAFLQALNIAWWLRSAFSSLAEWGKKLFASLIFLVIFHCDMYYMNKWGRSESLVCHKIYWENPYIFKYYIYVTCKNWALCSFQLQIGQGCLMQIFVYETFCDTIAFSVEGVCFYRNANINLYFKLHVFKSFNMRI